MKVEINSKMMFYIGVSGRAPVPPHPSRLLGLWPRPRGPPTQIDCIGFCTQRQIWNPTPKSNAEFKNPTPKFRNPTPSHTNPTPKCSFPAPNTKTKLSANLGDQPAHRETTDRGGAQRKISCAKDFGIECEFFSAKTMKSNAKGLMPSKKCNLADQAFSQHARSTCAQSTGIAPNI